MIFKSLKVSIGLLSVSVVKVTDVAVSARGQVCVSLIQ